MQIRTKLTLSFILVVAGLSIVSLFFIYLQFKNHSLSEFYGSLRSKGIMTAEMLVKNEAEASKLSPVVLNSQPGNVTPFTENILIIDAESNIIYTYNDATPPIPEKVLENIKRNKEFSFDNNEMLALGMYYTNRDNVPYYIISESTFDNTGLLSLRNILIFTFLFMILLVAFIGYIFAGQALAPVSKIMNEIDTILPSNLKKRISYSNQKDEISRLAATFNNLLDRIEHAFFIQKSFLSNISHELRNPLTTIIAQLEVTLHKERTDEAYKKTLYSILEDTRKLNEVSEKLMQLARINANGNQIEQYPLRLDEIIWEIREKMLRSNPEYSIDFHIQNLPADESALIINGNEALLSTALTNLIDNACKYGKSHKSWLYLDCKNDKSIELRIEDDGPGIAAEEKELIFEPFYRSNQTSHIQGSGVGLSLVSSILKLHQIPFNLQSRVNEGTRFALSFQTLSSGLAAQTMNQPDHVAV
ncbi:MAG: HAMP domain-containing protein [Saprospiraceae bacterium]|nr:HAMP domain-containing protein [Saprospiraceae bacterium]